MTDEYTPYETGLRTLVERLGRDHPRAADALVYQQRLTENIAAVRRYGDTETRRAARAEIVDRLNGLAREALDVSYNALCRAATDGGVEIAPPLGGAGPVTHIDTGGGAYVAGNVTVQGGDFVGRDQTKIGSSAMESRPTSPEEVGQISILTDYSPRPTVPAEGEPLALVAAALEARRLLLIWADIPFPPEARPAEPPALLVNRWREAAPGLPGTPFDFAHGAPWPLTGLPPFTILSLDPTDRLERAFRYAGVPLNLVRARQDAPTPSQHNLLKLGGDLDRRAGLLLDWDGVRAAGNDPDKAHLLREAGRVARDGVVLALAPAPSDAFLRVWQGLVRVVVRGARHHLALGPAGFAWPAPLTRLEGEIAGVLAALADRVIPPPLEPADAESLRRQRAEARENLRLLEERASEYVMSTDVPLQLVKEKRRLEARIAELDRRLGLGDSGGGRGA